MHVGASTNLARLNAFNSYGKKLALMEICGTHTHRIAEYGLRQLLPPNVRLVSGPGCPVCVTAKSYIDQALALLNEKNVLLATFGDLLHVTGSKSSLFEERAQKKDITVVYSPEEAQVLAKSNPKKTVVVLAVGFETTAPIFASLVLEHKQLENLCFLTALKRIEPVLKYMLSTLSLKIDGIICPGHVAAITGFAPFQEITEQYGVPAAICGFEPEDILGGICALLAQAMGIEKIRFLNLYSRCVKPEGNKRAQELMERVFKIEDAYWRGIGEIRDSALVLRSEFASFDAVERFGLEAIKDEPDNNCACGKILLGLAEPFECPLFACACTPEKPQGACMVSSEGTCAAYYKERAFGYER